jgi:5-methylcytosine-specific restriction endonuclease McrA
MVLSNIGWWLQFPKGAEFHHVIPCEEKINHRPENIMLLCHDCHKKETAKQRYAKSKKKKIDDELKKQQELFGGLNG